MSGWPTLDAARLRSLFVGDDWRITRRALVLTPVLLVTTAILEYVDLRTGFAIEPLDAVVQTFQLNTVAGPLVVVGLAAIHAYLNEGFLPSVLLASAPSYGALLWTIGSPERITNLYLDPLSAAARIYPAVPTYAAVGFFLGLGIAAIRTHLSKGQSSRHRSPERR